MKINEEQFKQDYFSMTWERLREKYQLKQHELQKVIRALKLSKPKGKPQKFFIDFI